MKKPLHQKVSKETGKRQKLLKQLFLINIFGLKVGRGAG